MISDIDKQARWGNLTYLEENDKQIGMELGELRRLTLRLKELNNSKEVNELHRKLEELKQGHVQ